MEDMIFIQALLAWLAVGVALDAVISLHKADRIESTWKRFGVKLACLVGIFIGAAATVQLFML